MGIFLIVLSLALLVFLVFKNVPVFFAAVVSSLFCLFTAFLFTGGMGVIDGMTSVKALADAKAPASYITGLTKYFGNYFWMFILGALFGKLYEVSGAANSIANGIIGKFGEKAVVPAILLAGFILTYGGVSVFVCFFALYPLMLSMFEKADISRKLIPAFYFAGAGTATGWMPGSPQLQNTIPADALGVSYSAALAPGMIAGIFEMVLVFLWIFYCVKRCKAKGLHFEVNEDDKKEMAKVQALSRLPGFVLSLVPMIVLLAVLNLTKLGAPTSLFIGVLAALACFYQYLVWKDIWPTLRTGLMGGVTSLFNTASVVGFGAVVQGTPAFSTIIGALTSISGNPVITSSLAVAVMAGVCGSGTGGEGIALPIIKQYFVEGMTPNQIAGLSRVCALSALTLDSLPHCGLVVTVIDYSKNTHKSSYMEAGVTNVVIPIITLFVLIPLCFLFGFA
jgi:H+/gluconate symporter-like permease